MLPLILALLASTSWGVADFLGGLKSRSLPVLVVLGCSQPIGLLAIGLLVALRGVGPPDAAFVPFALAGGVAVTVGISAFMRALAVGTMSIVAPISAVGSVVPVIAGFLAGERPVAGQLIGMGLATVGVVLAAREAPKPGEASRPIAAGAALAVVAALGFGLFLTAMHRASEDDAYWATLVQRLATIGLLAIAILARQPSFRPAGAHVPGLVAVGILDVSAAVLFAVASSQGMVSLIAVLASLYPIVTVFLAYVVLGERLAWIQRFGAAAAFGGVALITLA